jgi:ParB family transcriptional regulator, chromosome partitioning protein
MITESQNVRMIPINMITVLNPRIRNKRVFNELVTSIAHLGLKKPITVSRRAGKPGYDLVCGQGRLEALKVLGQNEIPAVIVEATEEDCYIMSLIENLARRNRTPLELMKEIGALKQRGYSIQEIAAKTDFSPEYVTAICYLLDHGEDRLIAAVDRGILPTSIALEIARAKDADVQLALTEAYENKSIPGKQVLAIRRIIAQRNQLGKRLSRRDGAAGSTAGKRLSVAVLIRAYRNQTERQKLLVKKAELAHSRLLFVVNALRRLLADENFVTLLRAESMQTMPKPLAERLALSRS